MTIYRRAWTMQLKPGAAQAYDAAHATVWPDLRQNMIDAGIHRFHLFRSGQTVFAMQERLQPFPPSGTPPSEVTIRWWQAMAPLMETVDGLRPLQTDLREVFSLVPPDSNEEPPHERHDRHRPDPSDPLHR
ncbi:L-rhamnose mutarotase [Jannaschia sp. M317]|uniref:L-rhamnose mutarotase n=1 Tax=Jannaschia sp. M317 TaxID=2867011 RepID=UPI0021A9040E|nr:L-rhamnose mutarotase [Jannaschia sp. M317]UWQ19824.1 L-rhamnose mutarotase [Jannaschia sp. M317]